MIVTDNLKDFPDRALAPYDIVAQTPDEFLEHLYDLNSDRMAEIVVELNAARTRPSEPLRVTLDRLAKAAPHFITQLRVHSRVTPLR